MRQHHCSSHPHWARELGPCRPLSRRTLRRVYSKAKMLRSVPITQSTTAPMAWARNSAKWSANASMRPKWATNQTHPSSQRHTLSRWTTAIFHWPQWAYWIKRNRVGNNAPTSSRPLLLRQCGTNKTNTTPTSGNKPLRRDISKIVLDHGGDYRVSQKVSTAPKHYTTITLPILALKTWQIVFGHVARARSWNGKTAEWAHATCR